MTVLKEFKCLEDWRNEVKFLDESAKIYSANGRIKTYFVRGKSFDGYFNMNVIKGSGSGVLKINM